MKYTTLFLSSTIYLAFARALICWNCVNEYSNNSCLQRGKSKICSRNQRSCQNEIRRGRFGVLITKGCKQTKACRNNLMSLRIILQNENLRCSRLKRRRSVCRCCCRTNNCNRNKLGCQGFFSETTTLQPSTLTTATMSTAMTTITSTASTPLSTSETVSTIMTATTSTETTLSDTTEIVSTTMAASSTTATASTANTTLLSTTSLLTTLTTFPMTSNFTESTIFTDTISVTMPQFESSVTFGITTVPRDPPDGASMPTCPHPGHPQYGNVSCAPEMLPNGRFVIETECEFDCNEGLFIEGSVSTTCLAIGNVARFSDSLPLCRRCQMLDPLLNGNYSCTQSLDTVCTAICNEGYGVAQNAINSTTCMGDALWTLPLPCCLRNCPPDLFADIIILLDISESVTVDRWNRMRDFVSQFVSLFNIGLETTQFAVIRFNDVIDREFQILLEDFSNDKEGLLNALADIPYVAQSHADTGLALQYALDVVLRSSNGDRRASNVLVVITDSEAYNDETVYINALSLRAEQIPTFVIGIEPDLPDHLNLEQLRNLAGEEESFFLIQDGFDGLNIDLMKIISGRLCSLRTCDSENRRFDSITNFPP